MPNIKRFEVEEFLIRRIRLIDLRAFFRMGSDYEITKYLNWGTLKRLSDARFMLLHKLIIYKRKQKLPSTCSIITKKGGKCIGWIEFFNDYQMADGIMLGFLLDRAYQGLGIMSKILPKVLDICYNRLGYNKVLMQTISLNERACKLITKLGFQCIQTLNYNHNNGKEVLICKQLVYAQTKEGYKKWLIESKG